MFKKTAKKESIKSKFKKFALSKEKMSKISGGV